MNTHTPSSCSEQTGKEKKRKKEKKNDLGKKTRFTRSYIKPESFELGLFTSVFSLPRVILGFALISGFEKCVR